MALNDALRADTDRFQEDNNELNCQLEEVYDDGDPEQVEPENE